MLVKCPECELQVSDKAPACPSLRLSNEAVSKAKTEPKTINEDASRTGLAKSAK